MIKVFKLPDLGEGLTESEIVAWHVMPGDTVELNQHIADVETAKAVVELPSPFAGTVTELHQEPGVVVHVGEPIVSFEVEGAGGAEPLSAGGDGAAQPVEAGFPGFSTPETDAAGGVENGVGSIPAEREAVLVGYGAAAERGGRPKRRPRLGGPGAERVETARPAPERVETARPAPERVEAARPAPERVEAARPAPERVEAARPAPERVETARPAPERVEAARPERPRSTPPVRALARELGVDLAMITGTGPDGLITRDDVRAKATGSAGAQDAASAARADTPTSQTGAQTRAESRAESRAQTGGQTAAQTGTAARETRSPIKSLRKVTAAAMVQSAFTAPHVTEFLTVDVTPTVELLEVLKHSRAFADYRIGILTVVAKALCIAVARNPSLNTRWDDTAGEIVQYNYVNLGIAAATPRGLIVPNIKEAQALGLTELASALAALTETARAGTTRQDALSGGTISITNIGVFGIDAGTPILNPGEAAILAMGGIRRAPWEYQGEIALRSVMTLSLSFDHRLVDGEQGSRFLADISSILANPGMVLTMV
jgi:pyruvate/2-oxoglutarate dehydrogenase complex dihydrolipoamide acyltransferase (E2) component